MLAEKGISIDIVSVEPGKLPEDLLDLNPYHSVPTLVDRDLVLYDRSSAWRSTGSSATGMHWCSRSSRTRTRRTRSN